MLHFYKKIFLVFMLSAAGKMYAQQPAATPFMDVTEQAGIQHQFVVYEGMFGGGVCVFDLNNDGFEDLYVTGGMNDDQLYLNQGNGTFRNILEGSGMEITKKFVTQGVCSADVNRDGWRDLFITTLTSRDSLPKIPRARNLFFLNNGNGTFRDATEEYGLAKYYSFTTGASFGDFNADGWPDLYVANYFVGYEGTLASINDATIAGANQTARGNLFRNDQGKGFTDVYKEYGMDHRGFGFGGVFTDYDNDGDQDLLINHDFGYKAVPSFMYKNKYPWKDFSDVSKISGMDLKINAMGAAVGDYNADGLLDYLVTNIRFNRFMTRETAGGPFVDKAKEMGMHFVMISWGANFADFDHDGDIDLFVANGDLNPNCTPMGDFFFVNDNNKFSDQARVFGLSDYGIGRGSAVFDIENDGDLDLIVVNQKPVYDQYPTPSITRLYRNESAAHGNWLKVALAGHFAESNGLGSRVTVVAGGKRMIREIDGGSSSHLSQNSVIAHFGLGDATTVDSVIVTWTGGKKQVLTNPKINTLIRVEEEGGPLNPWISYYWWGGGGVVFLLAMFVFFRRRK